mmetsp:Transcript_8698/g.24289  ORF Transcript_8698/g.24289 Transcript_8698/m.24289 type:complete len:84 (+) Transcript_8698:235-486(+)
MLFTVPLDAALETSAYCCFLCATSLGNLPHQEPNDNRIAEEHANLTEHKPASRSAASSTLADALKMMPELLFENLLLTQVYRI